MNDATKIKQQALAKMLKEMNEDHSAAEDKLHNWLCSQTDDWLFIGVMKKDKSIKSAMAYCKDKARRFTEKGVAVIEDDVVYNWVREYFLNEETASPKEVVKPVEKITQQIKKEEPKELEDEQLNLFDFG